MSSDSPIHTHSSESRISRIPDPARSHLRDLGVIVDGVQTRPIERGDLLLLMERLGRDDLAGVDLSGSDMRGIDIRGMNLSNAVMRDCNLEGALGKPMLRDVDGVSLAATDPAYELALNGWYTGETPRWIASVQPTVLDGADMNLSSLSGSDLRGASMRGATFTRGQMISADMSYVDLTGANLVWVKMDGLNLRRANLSDADLERARILDVNLTYTDLSDANLSGIFFSHGTKFEMAIWDAHYISILERNGQYQDAIELYRNLMAWHEVAGIRDVAGKFYYRMKESQRKAKLKSLVDHFGELRREAARPLKIFRR